eukprot:GHVT01060502.1.p1 GENE.GHVT01060502.1~~GHVT01060502.1.p1  ORF type:complete len:925 (-),score=221.48 GHVT01060502.1:900-3674(-)
MSFRAWGRPVAVSSSAGASVAPKSLASRSSASAAPSPASKGGAGPTSSNRQSQLCPPSSSSSSSCSSSSSSSSSSSLSSAAFHLSGSQYTRLDAFSGAFGWLSLEHRSLVCFDGIIFPSALHAVLYAQHGAAVWTAGPQPPAAVAAAGSAGQAETAAEISNAKQKKTKAREPEQEPAKEDQTETRDEEAQGQGEDRRQIDREVNAFFDLASAKLLAKHVEGLQEVNAWRANRLKFVEIIIRDKFRRSPELREKLAATGKRELVWRNRVDAFLGLVGNRGQNHLGRILMDLRRDIEDNTELDAWTVLCTSVETEASARPVIRLTERKEGSLEVVTHELKGRAYYRFGKLPDSDVVALNPSVSRRHAQVVVTKGGNVLLFDLGSKAKTFKNGVALAHSHVGVPLHSGDIFSLGVSKRHYHVEIDNSHVLVFFEKKVRELHREVDRLEGDVSDPLKLFSKHQTKVFVGGIGFKTTREDLRDYFSTCGDMLSIVLPQKEGGDLLHADGVDEETAGRGMAFIQFATPKGARLALERDGRSLGGRQLKVNLANLTREERMKESMAGGLPPSDASLPVGFVRPQQRGVPLLSTPDTAAAAGGATTGQARAATTAPITNTVPAPSAAAPTLVSSGAAAVVHASEGRASFNASVPPLEGRRGERSSQRRSRWDDAPPVGEAVVRGALTAATDAPPGPHASSSAAAAARGGRWDVVGHTPAIAPAPKRLRVRERAEETSRAAREKPRSRSRSPGRRKAHERCPPPNHHGREGTRARWREDVSAKRTPRQREHVDKETMRRNERHYQSRRSDPPRDNNRTRRDEEQLPDARRARDTQDRHRPSSQRGSRSSSSSSGRDGSRSSSRNSSRCSLASRSRSGGRGGSKRSVSAEGRSRSGSRDTGSQSSGSRKSECRSGASGMSSRSNSKEASGESAR